MKNAIIRNALKVFATGSAAAALGAAAIGLVYVAVSIFCAIPACVGYLAVLSFAVALMSVAAALVVVYMCGSWIVRKGKFSK